MGKNRDVFFAVAESEILGEYKIFCRDTWAKRRQKEEGL